MYKYTRLYHNALLRRRGADKPMASQFGGWYLVILGIVRLVGSSPRVGDTVE